MARYIGTPAATFDHRVETCTGVLAVNLGTPDAPTTGAVRTYLAEFLSDPRVVEAPRYLWWFILHGIILRRRPKQSAEAYRKVWGNMGSPLMAISQKQVVALQAYLDQHTDHSFRVQLAMRYGKPSIRTGLENLRRANAEKIIVLPLYPQYASPTTGSTFDMVFDVVRRWRNIPALHLIKHYHDDPMYIEALAGSVSEHWQANGRGERLVFSFHGLPKSYFFAGDPYYCECHKTARLVAEKLGLVEDAWILSFQSRFGFKKWLQPYTDKVLKKLAKRGTRHVDVICPGFSADCLETLEEIDIRYRALFLASGGEKFHYIPALNDRASHIATLAKIVQKFV